jgi:arylsulfatase A-like enzyme
MFTRAYTMQAVCGPARTAIMTGRLPDQNRVWHNRNLFRDTNPDTVTLPQLFKQHGYHVLGLGKTFSGDEREEDPASWSVPATVRVEGWRNYAIPRNEGGGKQAPYEAAEVPDDGHPDGKLAQLAVETLGKLQREAKPFFLAVGFFKPHLPFNAPKKYWDMQKPERIGRVPNPLPPVDVPQIALHNWQELRGYTDIPDLGPLTPEQVVHLRHGYHAAMSYTDAQIGRVLAELDRMGLRESTVICLWGDHGWHLGENGLWCKTTNFEVAARAPLIIAMPGQATAGSRSKSLVEFVDIYPTLAELCNLPPPAHFEGTSLIPVLRDPLQTVNAAAFSQYPRAADDKEFMGYSVRTDRYRLTRWVQQDDHSKVHAVELYDHQTDPQENTNIASKPANAELIARLTTHFDAARRRSP